mgnify:CR=1 FL=1
MGNDGRQCRHLGRAVWLTVGCTDRRDDGCGSSIADADYVRALVAERMKWEWVTLVRLVGGALVLWFAGTLAGRLRMAGR